MRITISGKNIDVTQGLKDLSLIHILGHLLKMKKIQIEQHKIRMNVEK